MTAEAAAIALYNAEDHIARVDRIADDISAAADEIDETRRLPKDLLDKMHGEKLFRLLLPKAYGGLEIDPATFFELPQLLLSAMPVLAGSPAKVMAVPLQRRTSRRQPPRKYGAKTLPESWRGDQVKQRLKCVMTAIT